MGRESGLDGPAGPFFGDRDSARRETEPSGSPLDENQEGWLAVADDLMDEYADVFDALAD